MSPRILQGHRQGQTIMFGRKLDQIDYKGVIKTIWNTTAALLQQYFIKAGTKFDRIKGVTFLSVTRTRDPKKKGTAKIAKETKSSAALNYEEYQELSR